MMVWCSPQGFYEPTICSAGNYCPPPGNVSLQCPQGYYCPIGSAEPIECPWLSMCAPGTIQPRQVGILLVLLLVDFALGAAFIAYYRFRQYKHQKSFSIVAETSEENLEAPPSRTATQVLIEGFNLARGNQSLLNFTFKDVGLSLSNGKKIIEGVSGVIRSGEVTAIMGPSGAGKTTFLATLMGKISSSWKAEGSLQVNGRESIGLSHLKRLVGYVPQDDVMHRELTVWQNLQYSADIRLPRDWNRDQRHRHVNAVLEVLDLTDVRNSTIGDDATRGVSGGQRKRVNIGLELAACPLALFCDEPTSGLDASASLSVVTAVKRVAQTTGITAVMVIHQPRQEIWNALDRVLILAPGGLTAFNHDRRHALPYFAHFFGIRVKRQDNPADVIMDYISAHASECARVWKESGKDWLDDFVSTQGVLSGDDDDAPTKPPKTDDGNIKESSGKKKRKKKRAIQLSTSAIELDEVDETPQVEDLPARNSKKHPTARNSSNEPSRMHEMIASEGEDAEEKVVRGANILMQVWWVLLRAIKSQYANIDSLALEMFLAVMAGAIIGFASQLHFTGIAIEPYSMLSPTPQISLIPQKSLYINMAVGIAAASAGVKTFSEDMVIYWREASSGHDRLAYYLGMSLANIPRIILGGLHFTALFQILSMTYVPFGTMLLNVTLIFFAVYGLAAIVSMVVPRKDAPLLAAVLGVVAAVLCGYIRNLPVQLCYLSYAYWSDNAYFTDEVGVMMAAYQWQITEQYFHLSAQHIPRDFGIMFSIGTIYRIIGFFLLTLLNRDKQR